MALSHAAIDELARKGAERGVDLRPGLARLEERLQDGSASELPFVEHAARHLIDAGGKRFRPMLTLLSGVAGGCDSADERLVDAGVVVELVHLSTLYHDDVMDGAELRRGTPAAHVRWSNTVAILTGDFLLARASELSAALGVEVTRVMARTIADLCAGQIREVQGSDAWRHGAPAVEPTREHYLAVIGDKTASLIAASCRLGGLLSGQSSDAVEALGAYGHRLGMSFQIADDLLDVAGEPGESGKMPGGDLLAGVWTLPVLLALHAEGPRSRLARLLDEVTGETVDEALELLRAHPALDQARDAARAEAAAAKEALACLEGSVVNATALEGLAELADHAAERVA